MVDVLTEDERARIETAVKAAEQKTSAEIVVMVAKNATDYREIELLIAAATALALPAVLLPFTTIPALMIWIAQIAFFVALALALPAVSAGRLVVGRGRLQRDVRAAAEAEFFAHGLRRTTARAAVLVYVALGEHDVEILADDAAAKVVSDAEWRGIAGDLARRIGAGDLVSGLEHTAQEIANRLGTALPKEPGSNNELPNVITR